MRSWCRPPSFSAAGRRPPRRLPRADPASRLRFVRPTVQHAYTDRLSNKNLPGMRSLDIAFFASSLVSAYWNGPATYSRGIVRALAERGHRITFYEPDADPRPQHRDLDGPTCA